MPSASRCWATPTPTPWPAATTSPAPTSRRGTWSGPSRNNLAGAYESAGDLERAIPLYETTLTQCEQVLGDTHPHTLTTRNNLARAHRAAQAVQQRSTATSSPAVDPQQSSTTD
ncbi:tetratricopeptide repeat protein [Streptomyces thermogriseus]|uniref:tetratricopeptide repeat protein n=1 Tax=Streptomyces thermogriseus TaxID=75292 RepID=UPI003D15D7C1